MGAVWWEVCMSFYWLLLNPQSDEEFTGQHFGVRVCHLVNDKNPVPMVLEMMLEHVEIHGLYTEGIYRKSGSANRMKELHQRLETGQCLCDVNYSLKIKWDTVLSWLCLCCCLCWCYFFVVFRPPPRLPWRLPHPHSDRPGEAVAEGAARPTHDLYTLQWFSACSGWGSRFPTGGGILQ